jgi:hypothetical protein
VRARSTGICRCVIPSNQERSTHILADFEDVDGLEQAAPNTTIHVKIPFSVSMRQPARSRPETTDNRVDFDGHGIRGIDLPAPGKWLCGLKSIKINHLHYITRR